MLGLKSLRRLTLWRSTRLFSRSIENEDVNHRKQLTQEEIKALKLRINLIQTGKPETYMELIKTIKSIDGLKDQTEFYTHPVLRQLVTSPVAQFMSNQSPQQSNRARLERKIFWLWTGLTILLTAYYFLPNQLVNKFTKKTNVLSSKKNADIQVSTNIKERFTDVLGIDEFKEELEEIVDFIKNRKKYLDVGAKLPKGILMVGPPGTGKTLMGRALAGQAGSSFIYKSASEFEKKYVGQGSKQIRKLFKLVKKDTPTIIFIDQIDSLAKKRSPNSPSFTRDTLNQLLQQLDGFETKDNVIVIGATNHKQSIDDALLRPGRFDKIIHVPMPDQKGRHVLLDYYIKKIKHETIDTEGLSKKIIGFSGADIKNLTNLAILHAIRNNRKAADSKDFDDMIVRIRMGVGRKNMYVSDEDKLMTAYHQIGHAFTSIKTKGATPFNMVTILPRGPALGFTSMVPQNDIYSSTKQEMQAQIDCLMGGRAAEELFFGDSKVTTGCSSDLSRATQIAYQYNKSYGMNPNIGLISLQGEQEQNKTSDKFNSSVDKQVNIMLKQSYKRVLKLLQNNRKTIDNIAKKLVQKETMTAEEVKQLF